MNGTGPRKEMDIFDVAPTILHLTGVVRPESMKGEYVLGT